MDILEKYQGIAVKFLPFYAYIYRDYPATEVWQEELATRINRLSKVMGIERFAEFNTAMINRVIGLDKDKKKWTLEEILVLCGYTEEGAKISIKIFR